MEQKSPIAYKLTVEETRTIVDFSVELPEKGEVYKAKFVSAFRQYARMLNDTKKDEDLIFFARAADPELLKTVSFVVPNHPISAVFAIVANKWAQETGAPFSFIYKPKNITMIDVVFPPEIISSTSAQRYGEYTEFELRNEIQGVFESVVVQELEDTEPEPGDNDDNLDLDNLDQYVIVEEEEGGDSFNSSLNDETQIEKGADINE